MKTRNFVHLWLFAVTVFLASTLLGPRAEASGRSARPFGIYAAILSDNMTEFGIALNLGDWLRLNGGYGQKTFSVLPSVDAKVKLYEAGFKLFVPSWSLSPFIGGAYTKGSADVVVNGTTYSASADGFSPTLGLDYQAGMLNIGLIIYVSTISAAGAYLGLFF